MHRGCFVWTPTPPLAGRRTPRPGPVRVCVCSAFLAGSGRLASRARSGAPHLFLWPPWLSALPRPLRAGVAPFLSLCLPLFFFALLPLRASVVSCFLWFPAPGALGLGAFFFFSAPPPVLFSFSLSLSSRSLCSPVVSGFLWFPAPGALGLGAVCCLFCWFAASGLCVHSCCFCV